MMVAGAVALTAMMGYAFLSGLIQIEVIDEKSRESLGSTKAYDRFNDRADEKEPEGVDSEQHGQGDDE